MTTWRRWADGLVEHVAAAVKAIRTSEGRSAANLSTRTGIGKPLSRAVISDLETGRKKTLDVTELLTLAAALNVSPLRLLVPNVLEDVEILPGITMSGSDVLGWFFGTYSLDAKGANHLAGDTATQLAFAIVEIDRALRDQRHSLWDAEHELRLAQAGTISLTTDFAHENVEIATQRIERLETRRSELERQYQIAIGGDDA